MERDEWVVHRSHLQDRLWGVLGRPDGMVEPACEVRSRSSLGDVVVERIVYEVEPDQSAPALLYLPGNAEPPFPAVAIAMGHGESKTTPGPLYAGPLYAKMVGKMVWDLMMGLSYLETRGDIDSNRLGCAGVSLGGTVTGYLLALDERLKVAIPAGRFFRPADREIGKDCSRIPAEEFQTFMTNGELLGLAAPHCAVLTANCDHDTVIDKVGFLAVRNLGETIEEASRIYRFFDEGDRIGMHMVPSVGHRHYYLTKTALLWAVRYLMPAGTSEADLLCSPEVGFGDWAEHHGVPLEKLENTEAHFRGLRAVDWRVEPLPEDERRCLEDGEIGNSRYTLEGWFRAAERQAGCA